MTAIKTTKPTPKKTAKAVPATDATPEQANTQAESLTDVATAPPQAHAEPGGDGKQGKHLVITADRDSFWRAGRNWTREPKTVPVDELTEDEILALKAEPVLTVVEA
jgi:hypothetical protein